ncbi:reverse transcriptase N-terminal domain-containing protein, partial [Planktothrix sp.]|uniref:reverse transcriptase N-terminal domain-containing protein n=1 Tax=Planktothrix sp. TaxID=3088171 RepID=UPI0038D3BD93
FIHTLINSWSAKCIAVRRVTQDNQGKNTAGVDGVKSLTPKQRINLVGKLKLTNKAKPTRRVDIPNFTPRVLIQSIVRVMKPNPLVSPQFKICDPACGTGGFLVCAYQWLLETTGGVFDRKDIK